MGRRLLRANQENYTKKEEIYRKIPYAYIFEKLGMGEIGGLGLCYYEPQGDAPTVTFETVIQEDGFIMPFKAHLKRMKLDPGRIVLPLLKDVRKLVGRKKAPGGRDGCRDCEILGKCYIPADFAKLFTYRQTSSRTQVLYVQTS